MDGFRRLPLHVAAANKGAMVQHLVSACLQHERLMSPRHQVSNPPPSLYNWESAYTCLISCQVSSGWADVAEDGIMAWMAASDLV
eukprot:1238534-Rhodomonas_salina.1